MLQWKLVLAYLLLVGLPVVILLGTLDAGRVLIAPPAVAGEWAVNVEGHPALADSCSGLLANLARPVLSIAQSGIAVVITLNDSRRTKFTGFLENGRFIGSTNHVRLAAGCADIALHLQVRVIGKSDQRLLQGQLSFDGCESCETVRFHASRLGRSTRQGNNA